MIPAPARFVARPPEVRALLITDASIDAACAWLAEHGRDGYREPAWAGVELVVIGRGRLAGFRVPEGWYLLHDGHAFRTVTAQHFHAAWQLAEDDEPVGAHAWRGQVGA